MTFQVMKVRLSYIHPQPPEADAPLFGWGIYQHLLIGCLGFRIAGGRTILSV